MMNHKQHTEIDFEQPLIALKFGSGDDFGVEPGLSLIGNTSALYAALRASCNQDFEKHLPVINW